MAATAMSRVVAPRLSCPDDGLDFCGGSGDIGTPGPSSCSGLARRRDMIPALAGGERLIAQTVDYPSRGGPTQTSRPFRCTHNPRTPTPHAGRHENRDDPRPG